MSLDKYHNFEVGQLVLTDIDGVWEIIDFSKSFGSDNVFATVKNIETEDVYEIETLWITPAKAFYEDQIKDAEQALEVLKTNYRNMFGTVLIQDILVELTRKHKFNKIALIKDLRKLSSDFATGQVFRDYVQKVYSPKYNQYKGHLSPVAMFDDDGLMYLSSAKFVAEQLLN